MSQDEDDDRVYCSRCDREVGSRAYVLDNQFLCAFCAGVYRKRRPAPVKYQISDAEIQAWIHDSEEHHIPPAPIGVVGVWADGERIALECGYSHYDEEHGVHAWLPLIPDRGDIALTGFTVEMLPPQTGILAPRGYTGHAVLLGDDDE